MNSSFMARSLSPEKNLPEPYLTSKSALLTLTFAVAIAWLPFQVILTGKLMGREVDFIVRLPVTLYSPFSLPAFTSEMVKVYSG